MNSAGHGSSSGTIVPAGVSDQAGLATILQQALTALQGMNAEMAVGEPRAVDHKQVSANAGPLLPSASAKGEKKNTVNKEKEGTKEEGKLNSKGYCHRCYGKGHVMSECTAELFCEVCGTDTHIKLKCPVFNAPKVHAIPAGFAIKNGGFFHIPSNKKLTKGSNENRLAIIQVVEGCISLDNVIRELERLLPGLGPWYVDQITPKVFRTSFPAAAELQRMIEWGPVQTKSQKAILEFKASSSGGRVKATLTDVWIQFDGLPSALCTYPHIWGVGSTLGTTVEVDMVFFRKHDICRMMVGVIDPEAVPSAGEVEINRVIYEVHYWVERHLVDGVPVPLAFDQDGEEGSKKDKDNLGDPKGKADRNKNGPENSSEEKNENGSKADGGQVQKEDVNGGADGGNHNLVVSHETHTASELQAFAPTELMDEHQGMAVDAVLEPMVDNFMVSGTPEMETRAARVERLAAIPETELPSGRKRRSCTTDEHSLARAERLKTERNGGTLPRNLLVSFLGDASKA